MRGSHSTLIRVLIVERKKYEDNKRNMRGWEDHLKSHQNSEYK